MEEDLDFLKRGLLSDIDAKIDFDDTEKIQEDTIELRKVVVKKKND